MVFLVNPSMAVSLSATMLCLRLETWLVRSLASSLLLAMVGCAPVHAGLGGADFVLEILPAAAAGDWDVVVRAKSGPERRLAMVDRDALVAVLRPIAEATPPHPSEPRCREGHVTIHAPAGLPFAEVVWLFCVVSSEGLYRIELEVPGRLPCDVSLPIDGARLMCPAGVSLGVDMTSMVVDGVREYVLVSNPFHYVDPDVQASAAGRRPLDVRPQPRVCGLTSLREAIVRWRETHEMSCEPPAILGAEATVLEVVQVVEVLRSTGSTQVDFAVAWADHATGRRRPR